MSRLYNVDVSADTTLVTTAETVVATLPGVSSARPGSTVRLHGEATITVGTTTTGITMRVRRDSLAGALVGEAEADAIESAAGSVETHDIVVTDVPGTEFAGQTYVLTATQVAATANGTAVHASLAAEVDP